MQRHVKRDLDDLMIIVVFPVFVFGIDVLAWRKSPNSLLKDVFF